MIFLIKYWRYIALILAVLAALGALWQFGRVQYQKGYDTAMSEVAKAKVIADEKTRTKQKTIIKKTQKVEDEILSNRDGDRPVSRIIREQLGRMRSGD